LAVLQLKVRGLFTVRVKVLEVVSCGVELSFTVTVTVEAPTAVGVPVMAPLLLMDNPAGSPVALNVRGEVPPLAATVLLYAAPVVPVARVAVVMPSEGGLTTRVSDVVAVAAGDALSFTVSTTVDVPAAVGVPVIDWPFTLNPAGSPVAENV
jgi:hypothetical protein